MKSWIRIILVVFVLIGGTISFGYWSTNQLNQAFDNLSAAYLASTYSVYPSLKQDVGLASTSPEISGEIATSTDLGLASTSPEISGTVATTTPPEFSFTFPQNNTQVYIGCTYPISWESSTTINSLETALIDSGTRETMGPITSGLPREKVIETDSQNLKWKVGIVWPGGYYIKVSKINGIEAELRSKVFQINKMSENISTSEKEIICKGSGGLL
ncbi:MAG: hypothetical protein WD896_00810 [Parcubacteria group bacterium]